MYTWYVLTITFVSEWTMVVVELSVFFCPSSWWHMHPQDHRLWHSRVRSIYSWMMVDIATYFEKVEAYICVSNYPVPSTHYLCNSGISKLKHSLYSHQDISSSVYCKQIHLAYDYTWCVHFWPAKQRWMKGKQCNMSTLLTRMWTHDIVQLSYECRCCILYILYILEAIDSR